MQDQRRAIIVGASSDIGLALGENWLKNGWHVIGTFRKAYAPLQALAVKFKKLVLCDLADNHSIDSCADTIIGENFSWDALVLCPATMEPIGNFSACDMDAWQKALHVNLVGPLRLLNKLLVSRNRRDPERLPLVLLFAGGGTNSAPLHYSAYTTSKIALIKAVELLDAEMPDIRFSIIGPGWVKTKIHQQTLDAGDNASAGAAAQTKDRLKGGDFTPMQQVIDCCNWLFHQPKEVIGGRNFSVVHDFKNIQELETALRSDPHMYKLRRSGNDRLT